MALALYRKYRPQKFSEIVGQEHVKKTLQNEIQQERLAHAYLFCGPRGISKTTMARILAKAVNCMQRKDSEPCNNCGNCQAIMEGRFFDLLEIDAASHTGVDHVRDQIIDTAKIVPSKGRFKVFVIDEVHMLSISAFNALLKILEEPPAHVIFILATTEVHKIPGTIISRCQRFDFRKIDNSSMIERLEWIAKKEKIAVEPAVFQRIARHAAGHQRDAESMLSQLLTLDDKKITLDMAELILPRSNTALVWQFVKNLEHEAEKNIDLLQEHITRGLDLEQFARDIVEFLRQLLLIKTSKKLDKTTSIDLDQNSFGQVLELVKTMPLPDMVLLLELFLEAEQKMKQDHFVVQLPLELALMKYVIARPQEKSEEPPQKTVVLENKKPQKAEKPGEVEKTERVMEKKVAATVNQNALESAWPQILKEIQKSNHSIAVSLKTGKIKNFAENIITIMFGYQFHCDFLSQPQQRLVMQKAIQTILGIDAIIRCELDGNMKPASPASQEPDQNTDNVLEIFGGQVVI